MKRPFWKLCILVFGLSPLLTGCWGYDEFEHQFYPFAVAVDKVDGQYLTYVQVLDMSQLGKDVGKNKEAPGAWIAVAKGATLDEAAHNFYQVTPRSVNWGHVNTLILTERALHDDDWTNIFGVFTRYSDFRYTTWVFATRDSPREILSSQPVIETSPVYSGLGDPIDLYRESSFVRPRRMNRLLANLQEPATAHLIPEISVDSNHWIEKGESHTALTLTGYSVFDQNLHFARYLEKEECRGLRWVDPLSQRTTLNLLKNGKPVGSAILTHPRVKIRPVVSNQTVRYQVQVSMKGTLPEAYGQESLREMDTIAEQEIHTEIDEAFREGVQDKLDLLGLQESLYRKNPALYHKLKRLNSFPLNADSLSVEVHVKLMSAGRTVEGPLRFGQGDG